MATIKQMNEEQTIFVQSAMSGKVKELANKAMSSYGDDAKIAKVKVYNISYENIEVEESAIDPLKNQNTYFVAALVELTTRDKTVHNFIAEDVYVVQNDKRLLVSFFDNYEYITKETVYEEYKKMVRAYKKDHPDGTTSSKLSSEYMKAYRDEIATGYKELFQFYKLKNKEFNQNTLENRRYMRIRKRLSRNILKELLISRIIVEYRDKNILT